ncbi:uncharacterized protein LACBIDRAFT_309702 [Laccaria bicolor S238N-H82]|uniref:Predicted protein n=1 Tax=Laccaria bicolor (strain S238N-H82 / ATCC MYA-4686) TaxID=486041 RepID=B0DSV9_LACBS|nr:uncharacterized protein LACBIDRAFT_309702 [Laccaria bicolor S238N-H82]EDR02311.1 predicted protein [Laccaria bicolor S238N-H82]|eukprot:XP_001886988.1 predicted protein [Laccaria bicolor S238N-H82]
MYTNTVSSLGVRRSTRLNEMLAGGLSFPSRGRLVASWASVWDNESHIKEICVEG